MIDLIPLAVLGVGEHVGIYGQHSAVWQKSPTLFVKNVLLICARDCPGQCGRIEQSALLAAAVRLHVSAISQNHALGVAD